ncbi:MAG TPA: tRNA (adenosine(37)-N6)-threonylcarbamoyltransferase complex ATPase subunit type 1 TsaE [Flavobacteriaceae bacterium]|nr:tRNA (adenosine(37)-N6)-threonylcarbamoyltransferase complex ATPase subunit type 1 TsaE [Flavobacteriaceae bacterium]
MEIKYSLEELPEVAAKIIEFSQNKIILFFGEMGAGKTTLIKEIVKQLGSSDHVSSPTFSLVNEYISNSGSIYHFDFHRIENEEEAFDMGFEEYVYSGAWKLIEWPQKIKHLLPENKTEVRLETAGSERKLTLI